MIPFKNFAKNGLLPLHLFEDMEIGDLDADFIKDALRLKSFNLSSRVLQSNTYKKEIQFIVRMTWFPEFDLADTISGTTVDKAKHNALVARLKEINSSNFSALAHYPMPGIGPGEFMFYFMYDECTIGGGSSAGVDLKLGNNEAELKSVEVSKTARGYVPKGYVSGFFMGGAQDTSALANEFKTAFDKIGIKSGGSGSGLEYGRGAMTSLKEKEPATFKKLESKFKRIASSYFGSHTVVFIDNNRKGKTYGEILHAGPVPTRNIQVEVITQSKIKPMVKVGR